MPPPAPPGSRMPEKPRAIFPVRGLPPTKFIVRPSPDMHHSLKLYMFGFFLLTYFDAKKRPDATLLLSPPGPIITRTSVGTALRCLRTSASSSLSRSCSFPMPTPDRSNKSASKCLFFSARHSFAADPIFNLTEVRYLYRVQDGAVASLIDSSRLLLRQVPLPGPCLFPSLSLSCGCPLFQLLHQRSK